MQRPAPDIRFEDCFFYHSIDLPGHGPITAPWDLRGREARYVGNVDLAGKRVLEFGPASGGLTAFMERSGAQVTCLEASAEHPVDILPNYKENLRAHAEAGRIVLERVSNAWWFTKSALGLEATVEYGDLGTPAEPAGAYDIAMLGAILVHCRSPYAFIHRACAAASEAVVVTELLAPGFESASANLIQFNPSRGASLIHWWSFTPGAIVNMLELHGFNNCVVSYHDQMHYPAGDFGAGLQPAKMFTVVGRRPPSA